MSITRRTAMAAFAATAAAPVLARKKALPDPVAGPIDDIAERLLTNFPEIAVYNGTAGALDGGALARRLDDYSPGGEAAARAEVKASQNLLARIRVRGGSPTARYLPVTNAILENGSRSADIPYGRINPFWFSGHVPYLVNQLAGPHIDTINVMMEQQSVGSVRAVDAWLEKLDSMDKAFGGVVDKLRADTAAGCRVPQVLLQKTMPLLDGLLTGPTAKQPIITVFAEKMAAAGLSRRIRQTALRRAIVALDRSARPGFARLRNEILAMMPATRLTAGVWAQPQGDALYAANIQMLGDTAQSPDEIHDTGSAEVARVSAQMNGLLAKAGLSQGSIGDRMAALARDPANLFADSAAGREQLLAYVRDKVGAAEARYSELLPPALRPRQALVVKRVPVATEASAPGGYYDGPSLDGTRPGTYWINLRDMGAVPRFRLPTLSYHEGVPGHHTQSAIAASQGSAPLLVQLASFNAYSEGWALYGEQLMAELGFYADDPLGDLGRLQDELFRAVRLVVDTGLHHKRWPREQAIDFMRSATGVAMSRVTAEIERYMAWPGQALGYKLGQLRLIAMRERYLAKKRGDLRTFHGIVLEGGAMPLALVEARLNLG